MNKDNKNVVSIEDRIPKLKEARKKKANRRLIFYMSLFFFLISIIVYLQSPLSEVKQVNVENNSFLSDEEIIELSGLSADTNIWSISLGDIEEKLENNRIIDKVEAKRNLPNTVTLQIKEIEIIGFMEEDSSYFPVLENGEYLDTVEYETFTGEAPLLVGFTDEEYLSKMASELNQIPQDIMNLISEIYWEPEEDNPNTILLYMNDGFVVKGTIRDFAERMTVYPSVVSQLDSDAKGIIHMGVGVYFEAFDSNEEDKNDEKDEESTES